MANREAVPATSASTLSSFGPYRRRLAIAEIARELQTAAQSAPAAAATGRRVDWSGLEDGVARLPGSPDPLVVFTELASALVPAVCERAVARVHLGDELGGWQQQPHLGGARVLSSRVDERGRSWSFTVHIAGAAPGISEADPGYLVDLICEGRGAPPTRSDMRLVKLAGRCAAAVVQCAGQADLLHRRQREIDRLQLAVDSERIVGAAVGVLMVQQSLSYPQALEALVAMSQDARVDLAAAAVLSAGTVSGAPYPRITV